MNGFRLVEGFSDGLFEERTGLGVGVLQRALGGLEGRGLIDRGTSTWRATPKGFRFLNEILVELLPDGKATDGG
jgi:coproporphyrinogen III oxidase-like Fe-S oxidoreductase